MDETLAYPVGEAEKRHTGTWWVIILSIFIIIVLVFFGWRAYSMFSEANKPNTNPGTSSEANLPDDTGAGSNSNANSGTNPDEGPAASLDKCQTDSDCEDYIARTDNKCLGTPRNCSFPLTQTCKSNDGYCPSACTSPSDLDCEPATSCTPEATYNCYSGDVYWYDSCNARGSLKQDCPSGCDTITNQCNAGSGGTPSSGDLIATGPITLSGMNFGGGLKQADCFIHTVAYFNLGSTFENSVRSLNYDLYIDGSKVSLLDYADTPVLENVNFSLSDKFNPGANQAYVQLKKSVANHQVKIVINTGGDYTEDTANNAIETTFTEGLMDLSVDSITYNSFLDHASIKVRRDKKLSECPEFEADVYIDGAKIDDPSVFGFMAESGMLLDIWAGGELSSGSHAIRVVLDTGNNVEESNEANNDITQSVSV